MIDPITVNYEKFIEDWRVEISKRNKEKMENNSAVRFERLQKVTDAIYYIKVEPISDNENSILIQCLLNVKEECNRK